MGVCRRGRWASRGGHHLYYTDLTSWRASLPGPTSRTQTELAIVGDDRLPAASALGLPLAAPAALQVHYARASYRSALTRLLRRERAKPGDRPEGLLAAHNLHDL